MDFRVAQCGGCPPRPRTRSGTESQLRGCEGASAHARPGEKLSEKLLISAGRGEAKLVRAGGHVPEAAAGYRKVWQNGREGKYGNLHYEMAAWGLGELMRSQKGYASAAAAYELISQASDPDPETLQKANLAAGEMYDLLQKRDLAMKKYQTVVAENGGTPLAEKARAHIREAYRE